VLIPLVAAGFLLRMDQVRMRHVVHTTGLFAEALPAAPDSPTGYAGGTRQLIVPERNNDSYHWIAQTQQMFARKEWRVRHVDYDNAPFGREVDSSSLYRWWLGGVAKLDHLISGRPLGQSVEQVALYADPLLHGLLVAGAFFFVAWRFGLFPAALGAAGLALLFPFAGWFVPGAPDDRGLSLALTVASVLTLLAGVRAAHEPDAAGTDSGRRAARWFYLAGVVGGFGIWVGVDNQVPVIAGIFLGGLVAAWTTRKQAPAGPPWSHLWQAWSFAGAAVVLGCWLLEYFPAHLGSWQLRTGHPLYGLAWLGLGIVLRQVTARPQPDRPRWSPRSLALLLLGVAAVAALPVAMWKLEDKGFLVAGISSFRLDKLAGRTVEPNLLAWLNLDGVAPAAWTLFLPVLLVIPAACLLASPKTRERTRVSLAIALGPVLVALALVGRHLGGWSLIDGMLLAVLVAAAAAAEESARPRVNRWMWSAAVSVVLGFGTIQLWPTAGALDLSALGQPEVVGLIQRDLARWLALRAGPDGAVVLAPPSETTALCYYGGLRGLGTLARENEDGIRAAIRIASASTPEEAKTLIDSRGVTHIIIPSWDAYLDEYARLGMGQIEGTFLQRVHNWRLPSWLRPVAYQLPTITGFEGQSVTIFAVVENQDDAAALSRIAEYFVETGQLDQAAAVSQALRQFPANLGALVARAEVEFAQNDLAAFSQSVERLLPRMTGLNDRQLPWDRRVSLAVTLAQAKRMDLARTQVQRCLEKVDAAKLRSLSTGSLYRLQVLGKAFNLKIADPQLQALALDLLPQDMRQRL
jgi:hypothetical protein